MEPSILYFLLDTVSTLNLESGQTINRTGRAGREGGDRMAKKKAAKKKKK